MFAYKLYNHFVHALFCFVCVLAKQEMSRAESNWEKLVRAALQRDKLGDGAFGGPKSGIAGNVPSSLPDNLHIDEILMAADEIQDDDPNIARICMVFNFLLLYIVASSLFLIFFS